MPTPMTMEEFIGQYPYLTSSEDFRLVARRCLPPDDEFTPKLIPLLIERDHTNESLIDLISRVARVLRGEFEPTLMTR